MHLMCFIYTTEKILLKCNHTNPIMSTLQVIHHLKKQSPNMAPESPPNQTPDQPPHLWVLMLPSVHLTLQCYQTCFLFHPLWLCTYWALSLECPLPFCDWPTPNGPVETTSESLSQRYFSASPAAGLRGGHHFLWATSKDLHGCRHPLLLQLHINLSVFPTTLCKSRDQVSVSPESSTEVGTLQRFKKYMLDWNKWQRLREEFLLPTHFW